MCFEAFDIITVDISIAFDKDFLLLDFVVVKVLFLLQLHLHILLTLLKQLYLLILL